MTDTSPQPKYRKDYCPPAYLVDDIAMDFDIQAAHTDVSTQMSVRRNPDAQGETWRLDGREMELLKIAIDGKLIDASNYVLDGTGLTLSKLPQQFTLSIQNRIEPDANTALEGFYRSGEILTTQCESNGFARITYFPDRPDVLARFRARLTADKKQYPILLSNGNLIEQGDVANGRHTVVWDDPHPKPCYLFAAVAGDLAEINDNYRTGSGRDIAIRFFTDHGSEHLCGHAIKSLQQAMAWDEKKYGLEYDLDTYMVVAVGSFNMGAMENKGLNIFNTACILASPETATDRDFVTVRDVVAHEYFHNYTGNRVTCRDWFQLSLKESLTVFREQQFAADHDSPGVTRIEQARIVRNVQFPEDAGPTAHPVRPESYIEMNNFYTITIYQKGAEVIRMMHTILGDSAFTAGVRYYLKEYDGQAVTIEDFVTALEESSKADLAQFRLWYSQAGTPEITVSDEFDNARGEYRLTLRQNLPDTPEQTNKKPMHIPVAMGLFDQTHSLIDTADSGLLHLRETEQTWRFDDLSARPTLSLLRGFSAPVKIKQDSSSAELAALMRLEDDAFARWEAAQRLLLQALIADVTARSTGNAPADYAELYSAFTALLADPPSDHALLAEMLTLPSESYLGEQFEKIDVAALIAAHTSLQAGLGKALTAQFEDLFGQTQTTDAYQFTPEQAGRRRLNGLCLRYLAAADAPGIADRCLQQYNDTDNMTDRMAALNALRDLDCDQRNQAFADFEQQWQASPLVLDKWFALHATSRVPAAFEMVKSLLEHPRFDLRNPNRVRALLRSFASGNMAEFHRADGAGYQFIADQVLALNRMNPQIAARIVGSFSQWRRYAGDNGQMMQSQLERILATDNLSPDVYEIVQKCLGSNQ